MIWDSRQYVAPLADDAGRAERRVSPARSAALARALLAVIVASALGCGTSGDDVERRCACNEFGCPEDVCNIGFDLPAACAELFETADVLVDGADVDDAVPGMPFESCTATIDVGGSASVQVRASDTWVSPIGQASCDVGGTTAVADFCTLRFELADSCRGLVDEATVVVEGVEVGTFEYGEPFVPCVLITAGTEVSATIRAGASYVLPASLRCNDGGSQPRLTMECLL